MADTIRFAKSCGSLVVLQPAPTSASVNVADIPWSDVDVLVPNASEAESLLRVLDPSGDREPPTDLVQRVAAATCVATVLVTTGSQGVQAYGPDLYEHLDAPLANEIVDTTGASDAFTAALALDLAGGVPLRQAIEWAQTSARRTLIAVGGHMSMQALTRRG